ncbi:histidine kinase [Sutcliffiella deserti]|uniref:histidine kinase n=1 Tax=Sutcliffiella deserti TaxID=2875501 RepID=UPI001CBEC7EB|nr:histidine kinase [Sutcliffiella deserti]
MEKVKWFLYLSAVLLVGIPTMLAIASGSTFSSTVSNIIISSAIVLVVLGKLLTVHEKRKDNKIFSGDIGVIIGLSLVLVIRFI